MQNRDFAVLKLKKNRNGFTLVELMIAIAILGIITVPIMGHFGDANVKNADNRVRQNAVVQAQDILEEFKNTPYSLDDSAEVCLKDSSSAKWSVKTPADPAAGIDAYTLQKTVQIDKSTFVVEAEIDPIQKVVEADATTVIEYERSVVGTMDSYRDVMISDNGQSLLAAKLFYYGKHVDKCAANNTPPVVSMDEIAKHLECTMLIKGTEESGGAGPSSGNVIVEAEFIYRYNGVTYPLGIDSSTVYTEPVKVSVVDPKELTNIYLFYQPATTSAVSAVDNIELDADSFFGDDNNIEDGQLNLFIIAQSSVSFNSSEVPAGYIKRNSGYKLNLSDISTGSYFKSKIGKVYTNLSYSDNELFATGFGSDQFAMNVGNTEYTLVNQEKVNRVADITVRIIKDGEEYAVVNGSKVQN